MSSLSLWPEQQAAYNFAASRKETALFCEQRTGKTFITLCLLRKAAGAAINLKTGTGNDFCGLLVTLLTNRDSTWLDGIRKFLPWLNVTSDWEEFKKLPCPRVLLIHYEMLPKLIGKLVKYKKLNWACVDEAQRLSNRGNGASRAMARLSWIDTKLVLTGTPQEVRETDYFGIFKFLKPEAFGTRWESFEKRYMDWPKVDFENSPPGSALWQQRTLQQRILKNKATFREDRRQEFIDAIKPYSTRLTKLDVGITQAKVHKVLVGMSVDQERVYRQLTKDSFAYLPARSKRRAKKRVTAPLAITLIAKQRQVATGFVYDDEGNLHDLGENKLSKLLELVTVLSKPLVVFTAFRPDNDLVYEALVNRGYDVVQVNGSTKKKLRPQIWRDFQRAQFDVAVVQTKTGGTGVDLWKARNAVVYSMTHSYRDWDQSLSRLDSKHNKSPSEFFVLCTKNTVDEHLFDLVIVKKLTTEEILKHLKRGPQPWHVRQPQKSLKPKSLKPRRARKLNPSME